MVVAVAENERPIDSWRCQCLRWPVYRPRLFLLLLFRLLLLLRLNEDELDVNQVLANVSAVESNDSKKP
jgi:hypothetical protein